MAPATATVMSAHLGNGIQLSQLSREPGQAVVVMLVCGEAVVLPFLAAIAMAKMG